MHFYRYCPLCATELTTGAEGERICPKGHFTKYADVSVAAEVVPVKDGQVLLSRRGIEPYKGTLDIIGGFVNPGETGEEAALREAREETGGKFKITQLLGTYPDVYKTPTQDKPTIALVYLAEYISGELKADDDITEINWYPIDSLPADFGEKGFPVLKRFKEDLLKWWQSQ